MGRIAAATDEQGPASRHRPPASKAARPVKLEAKVGLRLPGQVEVLEGLQAGDTVVIAGHARLLRADSVPVRPVDLARAAVPALAPVAGPASTPAPARAASAQN